MGQGGYITLVNGTNCNWVLTKEHSYQMDRWEFPSTVAAGTSVTVYVEWNDSWIHTTSDDAGEATYSLSGTGHSFQIQARAQHGFNLQVELTSISTMGHAQGSVIPLGWKHDGYVDFILAGEEGNFISNNMPTAWMQSNVNVLGDKTLRELCIPGSHDAGMSTYTSGTAFSYECNTLTQTKSVYDQLVAGARYFDIRPVISAGQYYTGHYSLIVDMSWQGGNGQSIASIIEDVNRFTATNKELVILYLSHDYNTDVGNMSYRHFTQEEWDGLFEELMALNNLYTAASPEPDLTMLKLNDYIGGERAAVAVIVDPGVPSTHLGNYSQRGLYLKNCFKVFDSYSETNILNDMMSDQLEKLRVQKPTPDACYFLLSWTLTQGVSQATSCYLPGIKSILDLANEANPQLYTTLTQYTNKCYPNILYIDNVTISTIASFAMAVNWKAKH